MYVRRLHLHGVKTLWRDIPEGGGPLPEAARHRLLLQGGNGSGKTTILETIRTLWELFGEWIDQGPPPYIIIDPYAPKLAAMELAGFTNEGQSLWVGIGSTDAWDELKSRHPDALFAGKTWEAKDSVRRKLDVVELPVGDWKAFRHRSMVGSDPRPNIISFPPDDRRVIAPPERRPRLIDTTAQGWSAVYSPGIDLESVLLTVGAMRPGVFDRTLHLVNLALRHRDKRITGWGNDGRLQVEGTTPDGRSYTHTVDRLSSGERQMLLMIAYVAGFLRHGGIVLIDEPDLHIHLSMVTQLMQTLDLIVRERGGQMIVASHSERVWDFFPRDSEKIELTPWRGGE